MSTNNMAMNDEKYKHLPEGWSCHCYWHARDYPQDVYHCQGFICVPLTRVRDLQRNEYFEMFLKSLSTATEFSSTHLIVSGRT